jgi:hypothetical protein
MKEMSRDVDAEPKAAERFRFERLDVRDPEQKQPLRREPVSNSFEYDPRIVKMLEHVRHDDEVEALRRELGVLSSPDVDPRWVALESVACLRCCLIARLDAPDVPAPACELGERDTGSATDVEHSAGRQRNGRVLRAEAKPVRDPKRITHQAARDASSSRVVRPERDVVVGVVGADSLRRRTRCRNHQPTVRAGSEAEAAWQAVPPVVVTT